MGQVDKRKPAKIGADVVDRPKILAAILAGNPHARASEIAMYTDAFVDYRTAQLNINANGSIVFHPRTGAPIDNPYIAIRDRAGVLLRKIRLNTDMLW